MPLIVQNCTISFKRFEEMNSIRTRQEFVEKLKLLANLPCRYDGQLSLNQHKTLKPWPNGVASGRKLKTWVYLPRCLARACAHLSWLAMACAHFGRDQICTQVKASFSPFGHPSQVNASGVTFISLSLTNEIQEMSALKWVHMWLACTCEETCLSVWPPNASLYASSTCRYLRVLASPFGQGFGDLGPVSRSSR